MKSISEYSSSSSNSVFVSSFMVSFKRDVSCGLAYLALRFVAEAMGDLGVTLAINNKVSLSDTSDFIDACDLDVVKFSVAVALMA